MRSPLHSEAEALDFLLLVIVVLLAIALAVSIGPTWLTLVVIAVVVTGLAARRARMRAVRRNTLKVELKSAPAHAGPADERRILLVANDTLNEASFIREVEALASVPKARVFMLAPAIISAGARLTGDIDHALDQARARLAEALDRIPGDLDAAGKISDAEPLEAIEDAVATFAPDQIIISTRAEQTSGGLDPKLASLARKRFALPVSELTVGSAVSA
jgi:GABA permease